MSAIGQPAGDGAGTTETAAPEATSGPDYGAVMDRVGEIASGLEGLQSSFQDFVQAQQPAPEPEQDPWETLFGTPEPEPAPEPAQQFDPAMFQQAVQQTVQQALAQQLGPVSQTVQQMQQQQQLAQLYRDVPQLADTPENAEVRQQTAERVQAALEGAPPEVAAYLSNSPSFIQTIFKAAEADRLAQAQEPAGGVQVLEGGGAHPGGTGQGGESIVQQVMSNRVSLPKGFR